MLALYIFEKKIFILSPPQQKLKKILHHTSCSMTWPPNLQLASYATDIVMRYVGGNCPKI